MTDVASLEPNLTETNSAVEHPFLFHGQGFEFFKIWIVNIFLTIITLGIYSPWALVRNRRYFYGNTQVMNARFDYLADPFKILIGRIIAVILLIVISALSALNPALYAIAILALYAALPWIINKSLRFNAYNTSYRNIRFDFNGTYFKAFMAFIVWPILGLLSVFLLMPLALKKQQEYIANNSLYGRTNFELTLPTGAVYLITFISITISIVVGIAVYFAFSGTDTSFLENANPDLSADQAALNAKIFLGILAFYFGVLISTFYLFVMMTNLMYNNLILAGNGFKSTLTIAGYAGLILTNLVLLIVTLGIATPWIKVRNARYMASKLQFIANGNIEEFVQAEANETSALGEQIGDVFELGI